MANEIETRLIHAGEPAHRRRRRRADFPVLDLRHARRRERLPRHPLHPPQQHAEPRRPARRSSRRSRAARPRSSPPAAWPRSPRRSSPSPAASTSSRSACLYGGTHDFFTGESSRGSASRSTSSTPTTRRRGAAKLRPNTQAIYVETITNPLLDVADLAAIVAFAREHGLVTLIDNTFASPINFRPIEHGYDLSLHSATKYLNGHDDSSPAR